MSVLPRTLLVTCVGAGKVGMVLSFSLLYLPSLEAPQEYLLEEYARGAALYRRHKALNYLPSEMHVTLRDLWGSRGLELPLCQGAAMAVAHWLPCSPHWSAEVGLTSHLQAAQSSQCNQEEGRTPREYHFPDRERLEPTFV